MSVLTNEPYGGVDSMEELFAIAAEMERAAIDGYSRLAGRMRREGRSDLAAIFDRLVEDGRGHRADVERWAKAATGAASDASIAWDVGPVFDDGGAGSVAPELLSAYRAFAIAVRNEERTFAFWSYLAARADSDEVRTACERMAHAELEHVATLRRERRRAFHAQREAASPAAAWSVTVLEARLAELLDAAGPAGSGFGTLARQARRRAAALDAAPLGESPLLARVSADAADRLLPCTELLLEGYLNLAERLPEQEARDRAQGFAAQLLECLAAVRPAGG